MSGPSNTQRACRREWRHAVSQQWPGTAASDTVCAILLGTGCLAPGILSMCCLSSNLPPSNPRRRAQVLRSMAGSWIVARKFFLVCVPQNKSVAVACLTALELRPSTFAVIDVSKSKGATNARDKYNNWAWACLKTSISEHVQGLNCVGGCVIVGWTHGKSMMRLRYHVHVFGN